MIDFRIADTFTDSLAMAEPKQRPKECSVHCARMYTELLSIPCINGYK